MDKPFVHRERFEDIVTLRLDRPERLNPVDVSMQRALLAEFEEAHRDRTIRCLVLTGGGRAFSVGADLTEMDSILQAGNIPLPKSVGAWAGTVAQECSNPLLLAVRNSRVPVICAVNGVAAGGAVGLALAADVVILAESAYFYLPFAPRLGILPDMGITWWLPRLAGRGRAMASALLDQRISAAQAVQWGLAWASFDDGQLGCETQKIARRLAALPSGIVSRLRQAYDQGEHNDFGRQLAYECAQQGALIDGPDFAEGVLSFREKRPPVFHAR